ncbi:MAG: NlpC/P60 family protein [Paracoccaceae bacterium]
MSELNAADLARKWIGTPYVHQASARGAGADCLGLLRGVWREMFAVEPEAVPPYTPDWSEVQHDEHLWRAARRHMRPKPVAEMQRGDVILFRMRAGSVAKHLGILVQTGADARFIHSYSGHGVVESPLSEPWRRRIVAVFAFPLRRN